MSLPFVTVPAFPNVPNLPGVPALIRNPLSIVAPQITRVLTDVAIIAKLLGIRTIPPWGIFDASGKTPIMQGDSVVSVAPRRSATISDYPVELGQFQTYNRVMRPREVTVTVTKGGTLDSKSIFLSILDGAISTTALFTVVQPEYMISNMNVVDYDYDRTQLQGATLLKVDIHLREVLQTATTTFSNSSQANGGAPPTTPLTNTASPNAQDPVNGGAVAPAAVNTTSPVPQSATAYA